MGPLIPPNCTYLWTYTQSLALNTGNPANDNYSILHRITDFKNTDGKYRLRYVNGVNGNANEWRQTSNFTTASSVSGYQTINLYKSGAGWGGLRLTSHNSTWFDGTNSGNWWFAAGVTTLYHGKYPGHYPDKLDKVEIWVLKEN